MQARSEATSPADASQARAAPDAVAVSRLPAPAALRRALPLSPRAAAARRRAVRDIRDILRGRDPHRLLVVAGPCSIHDRGSALRYARRLGRLQDATRDELVLVMRCYFEKPRSTTGWKGLLSDPGLDGTLRGEAGLELARDVLVSIGDLGVACGSELLDPVAARYLEDGLAWVAIGARTSESQLHRALASGLDAPVGFKNGMDGALDAPLGALASAREPQSLLGVADDGAAALFRTRGNPDGHVVLRGGRAGPNHDAASVRRAAARVRAAGGPRRPILVDCSHGNSHKDHRRQGGVCRDVLEQVAGGRDAIAGLMLESHLQAGRQDWRPEETPRPDVSLTDACIGWEETEHWIRRAAEVVKSRR